MNERIKSAVEKFKNPKVMIVCGICGIVLILLSELSGLTGGKKNNEVSTDQQTLLQYRQELTQSIERIVTDISGDKKPTVVITLDTAVRVTYADLSESDTENSVSGESTQSREASKKSYITVKGSDGSEQALQVTQIMPSIRGVAIVCGGGDDDTVREKIENAVTAALNITSKRVCVLGGADNEKG